KSSWCPGNQSERDDVRNVGRGDESHTRPLGSEGEKCSDRNPPSVTRQSPVSSNTACSSRRYHSRRADTDAVAYTDSSRVRGWGARRRIFAEDSELVVHRPPSVRVADCKRVGNISTLQRLSAPAAP